MLEYEKVMVIVGVKYIVYVEEFYKFYCLLWMFLVVMWYIIR